MLIISYGHAVVSAHRAIIDISRIRIRVSNPQDCGQALRRGLDVARHGPALVEAMAGNPLIRKLDRYYRSPLPGLSTADAKDAGCIFAEDLAHRVSAQAQLFDLGNLAVVSHGRRIIRPQHNPIRTHFVYQKTQ